MIQRIQSLYLLLAFIFLAGAVFTAHAVFGRPDLHLNFSPFGLLSQENNSVVIRFPYVLMLGTLGIAMAGLLWSIFLYNNRKHQIRMIRVFSFLLVTHLVLEAFLLRLAGSSATEYCGPGADSPSWGAGILFPLLALACCVLAVSRIKHDEELVKSADRIR